MKVHRHRERDHSESWDLSTPLLEFSAQQDYWTLGDAVQGLAILGATGSGKSSGVAKDVACAFLANDFGGLVLTAKPDEVNTWIGYCKKTNRLDDLLIFAPSQKYRFNFLQHEYVHGARGAGSTYNLVSLFQNLLELKDRKRGSGSDPFWMDAARQMLTSALDVLAAAGEISLPAVHEMVTSLADSREEAISDDWAKNSFCGRMLERAAGNTGLGPTREKDVAAAIGYFLNEVPRMPEKTRGSVVMTLTSMAHPFLTGQLRELFCTTTNIRPEDTADGKIIVVDLSVKEYRELGVFSQVLWKLCWQRAVETRTGSNLRPVFLFCDEYMNFCTPGDILYQSTARSARACTVAICQNISSLYSALGGHAESLGRSLTNALLGNLTTKVFCNNDDAVTNKWAADMIGQDWTYKESYGASTGGKEGTGTGSANVSEERRYLVEPIDFARLPRGGKTNNGRVETIVYRSGTPFNASGQNHLHVAFLQDL